MKRMFKRIAAAFLASAVMVGALPVVALAEAGQAVNPPSAANVAGPEQLRLVQEALDAGLEYAIFPGYQGQNFVDLHPGTIAELSKNGLGALVVVGTKYAALFPAEALPAFNDGDTLRVFMEKAAPMTKEVLDTAKLYNKSNNTLFDNSAFNVYAYCGGEVVTQLDAKVTLVVNTDGLTISDANKAKLYGAHVHNGSTLALMTTSAWNDDRSAVFDDWYLNTFKGKGFAFETEHFSDYGDYDLLDSYGTLGAFGLMAADKVTTIQLALDDENYTVNGVKKTSDQPPVLINDWTMVPLRLISEDLGAEVTWNEETNTAMISMDHKTIFITEGVKPRGMRVAPVVENGRMLIPLRYVSELLGCTVDWDGAEKSVQITKAIG